MLSFTAESRALSAQLYADGFSLPIGEASDDLSTLCHAGAIPLALTRGDATLSQGIGIPIDTDSGRILYLYALTTDRASRGQGLLRTLLRESAAMARDAGFTALCLIPANASLLAAYRRMGFTEELPTGGAASIQAPTDLSYRFDRTMYPITDVDALYAALGRHMSRGIFDFSLATLAPAVLPMCTEEGDYALVSAHDPHYALVTSFPAPRTGAHTLLCAPIHALPDCIIEPLPR